MLPRESRPFLPVKAARLRRSWMNSSTGFCSVRAHFIKSRVVCLKAASTDWEHLAGSLVQVEGMDTERPFRK